LNSDRATDRATERCLLPTSGFWFGYRCIGITNKDENIIWTNGIFTTVSGFSVLSPSRHKPAKAAFRLALALRFQPFFDRFPSLNQRSD